MEDDSSEGLAKEELLNAKERDIFTAAARVWHSEFADLASMEVEKAKAILTAAATGIFSDAGLLHCGHAWDSAAQPRREGEPQVSKYPHPSYKDIYVTIFLTL